jgi:hypothetical protein
MRAQLPSCNQTMQLKKNLNMNDNNRSGGQFFKIAAAGAFVTSAVGPSTGVAEAHQGNMEHALLELQTAPRSLR